MELHGMPPPPPNIGSNETYNSMNMNWPAYRSDPRLPSTAGPYETSFSFSSHTQQRSNEQNHARHHSDPRHDNASITYANANTHLPPIVQVPVMNTYSSPPPPSVGVNGDEGEHHHVHTHDTNVIPSLAQFDDAYRGGGSHNESVQQGLLEQSNNMRMSGVQYQSSTLIQDPRGSNNDQFNNAPMGSHYNVQDSPSAFEQWHTFK